MKKFLSCLRWDTIRQAYKRAATLSGARVSSLAGIRGCVDRQHQLLLGLGLFLLLCWIIGSIWLVNLQRQNARHEESQEEPMTIARTDFPERGRLLFPGSAPWPGGNL